MADIRIEKKRKPIWPWLLGLVILLALGWGVFEAFDTDDMGQETVITQRETPVETGEEGEQEPEGMAFEGEEQTKAPEEVQEFVSFAEREDTMGLDHEYTSEGLNKLADALNAVSEEAQVQNEQLDKKLENIRSKADFIQKDPEVLKHADSINAAFADANDAFEMIQNEGFPDMSGEVEDLRSSTKEFSPQEPTLEQREAVKDYFEESAKTLETFSNNLEEMEEEV